MLAQRAMPNAAVKLQALAPWSGFGFALLALVMAIASYGALTRRAWGRGLAIAVFAANALGDLSRIPFGAVGEGIFGASSAGAIIWGLTRPSVRGSFSRR